MGLFNFGNKPDASAVEVNLLRQLEEKADYAAWLESKVADLTKQLDNLNRLTSLGKSVEIAGEGILTLAAAVAEGNKQIASALSSLALATERGARAKQAEVEFNKAQGVPNV